MSKIGDVIRKANYKDNPEKLKIKPEVKEKLMEGFKLNTNKKVMQENLDIVLPQIGKENWLLRSVSFTPESDFKINRLRAKYKLSRSAIIRILLDSVE